jgi:hypothetical protein
VFSISKLVYKISNELQPAIFVLNQGVFKSLWFVDVIFFIINNIVKIWYDLIIQLSLKLVCFYIYIYIYIYIHIKRIYVFMYLFIYVCSDLTHKI